MNDLNLKTVTVAIITNKKHTNTNEKYSVYLEPIIITLSTFKHSFFTYNQYTPNEFLDITNFNYYNVVKRINNNDNSTPVESKNNELDSIDDQSYSCDTEVKLYENNNLSIPLSLYQETLSIFMNYNNILSENAINPKLLIDFSNEIFKYKNFKDIPIVLSSMNWTNILHWLNEHENENRILCLHIEFHYYEPHFMPHYIKYVFPYYIC
jgi:hypothetical protein